jgi:hypothetical protein
VLRDALVTAERYQVGSVLCVQLDFQHFRRRDIESPRIDLTG